MWINCRIGVEQRREQREIGQGKGDCKEQQLSNTFKAGERDEEEEWIRLIWKDRKRSLIPRIYIDSSCFLNSYLGTLCIPQTPTPS